MAGRPFVFIAFVSIQILFFSGCSGGSSGPIQTDAAAQTNKELFIAIVDNDFTKVKALVSTGANLERGVGEPGKEITPLIAATALNRELIAQYLIEQGASRYSTFEGYSVRDFAIRVFGDQNPVTRQLRMEGGN